MDYDQWGRCDAITSKGKRCTKRATSIFPCAAIVHTSDSTNIKPFRGVHLCHDHSCVHSENITKNKRTKLHHGGWFGSYNKYQFGNLVITAQNVVWDKIKNLKIPKYWGKHEEERNP